MTTVAAILARFKPVRRSTRLAECARCKHQRAASDNRCPVCGLLASDEDDASDPNDPRHWLSRGGRST